MEFFIIAIIKIATLELVINVIYYNNKKGGFIMEDFIYDIKTEIIFGKNKIDQVGQKIIENDGHNVLLMYGMSSIKRSGLYDQAIASLTKSNLNVFELANIKPNPSIESVRVGQKMIKDHKIDFVLAVGGGSVIDCAKAVCASAYYEGDPWDFFIDKASVTNGLKLGTILTLAATGSEMNTGGVLSNDETQQKLAFGHPSLRPIFTFEDPTLMYSLPAYQTAAGASDIISHLLEQYFTSHKDDGLSDRMIEAMIVNVINYTKTAIDNPDNYDARANLMWTSSLALNGMVICGKTGGDWACHMIEHEVSAIYDVTHGAGLAILHPSVLQTYLNKDIEQRLPLVKFRNLAQNVFKIQTEENEQTLAQLCIQKFTEFFESINMPTKLIQENVDQTNFELMAEKALLHSDVGSYHKLNHNDIVEIFNRVK